GVTIRDDCPGLNCPAIGKHDSGGLSILDEDALDLRANGRVTAMALMRSGQSESDVLKTPFAVILTRDDGGGKQRAIRHEGELRGRQREIWPGSAAHGTGTLIPDELLQHFRECGLAVTEEYGEHLSHLVQI